MTDEERNDKRDALRRFETLRREQLGAAINLIMGLSAAGVGFCVSRVADKGSHFSMPGACIFLAALVILVFTVAVGIIVTCTRLSDFRLTANVIREELAENPDERKLKEWRGRTHTLGTWTWGLFRTQSIAFGLGVIVLASSIWTLNHDHLFTSIEPVKLLNGEIVEPYVITGRYSVNEATHVRQMAECKADIKRFVDEINLNARKPGETLLLDAYDGAFLRGHICAGYAAEPLEKDAREVIEGLSSLDSLMMATERLRYENLKEQLDSYRKRFR